MVKATLDGAESSTATVRRTGRWLGMDGAFPLNDPDPSLHLDSEKTHRARVALLTRLKEDGYQFITPTPRTHRRVLGHPDKVHAASLRDVFGWSLTFDSDLLDVELFSLLEAAGGLVRYGLGYRSAFRVSSLGRDLFLHSAFPAKGEDAVFFGPDTYRFARFLGHHLHGEPRGVAVDIGSGSGAGAVAVARLAAVDRLILTDVNTQALSLARANVEAAGLTGEGVLCEGLDGLDTPCDLIIANPPYMAGDGGRTYRDGGDMHGAKLSLDWALDGAKRLAPGGRLLLYTGVAIIEGEDPLRQALEAQLDPQAFILTYSEIDPDIFGEMLTKPAYQDADRIAAIGAVVDRIR